MTPTEMPPSAVSLATATKEDPELERVADIRDEDIIFGAPGKVSGHSDTPETQGARDASPPLASSLHPPPGFTSDSRFTEAEVIEQLMAKLRKAEEENEAIKRAMAAAVVPGERNHPTTGGSEVGNRYHSLLLNLEN